MSTHPPGIELRDEHLDSLRRFLLGVPPGAEAFAEDLNEAEADAERVLLFAATAIAVRRRFSSYFTQRQIIRFVADLRISMGEDARGLDPRALEEVIRAALGTVHPNDIRFSVRDPAMTIRSHLLILEKLWSQNVIPSGELDEFMHETLAFARQMLETHPDLADGTLTL